MYEELTLCIQLIIQVTSFKVVNILDSVTSDEYAKCFSLPYCENYCIFRQFEVIMYTNTK